MTRSPWAARRERAAHLLRQTPHAEEMLVFYIRLTEVQERVAERVPVDGWLDAVRADEGTPPLRPERLPATALLDLFDAFLDGLLDVGTDVIVDDARALLEAEAAERSTALIQAAGFCGRAFLEPVWTTLAGALEARDPPELASRCPTCASRPVVSVLQDLPDALGARTLLCPLCSTAWRLDRLTCAACGEGSSERLAVHTAASVPWVRVDECLTCRRYMKTVDLRERGDAVPVVDELATVELDIWARERGLTKVQTNVLDL